MEFIEGKSYVFVLPGGERISGEFTKEIDGNWLEIKDVKSQEVVWVNTGQVSAIRSMMF